MARERVVLAMSGGVDSSVAAHLLRQENFDVVGVFMRHGEEHEDTCSPIAPATDAGSSLELPILSQARNKQGCCTASDALDARRVADRLEIPFYALNLEEDFGRIIDYFADEYAGGRTPNPCVVCNIWLKFGKLFEYADGIGAKYVATGHYARLVRSPDTNVPPQLWRGIDHDKDQSYVLFGVQRDRLERMLLPIGGYRKTEIRQIAADMGLRVANKKDSQEICFVQSGQHAEFVRARRPDDDRSGEIVTTDGRVVGRHPGIEGFTIGQRKGLRVAMGTPFFVVGIDASQNRVIIGPHHELARQRLTANRLNWLEDLPTEFDCRAQIRYNSAATAAHATIETPERLAVSFDQPCHGVAPGQAVVCYDGDRVLGGGWIDTTSQ